MDILQPRTETFKLAKGTGRIEVRGDYHACGLFLDGEPFVFNIADCQGSIGQYVYYFALASDDAPIATLSDITAQLPATDISLAQSILLLLCQFPSGTYTLTLAPFTDRAPFLEYNRPDYYRKLGYTKSGYYPDDEQMLVMTQPEELLDQERIAHYWYAIEAGARPFAITTTTKDAMCEFVLDGHHKIWAYHYAQISPWRLCISKATTPLVESDWPTHLREPPGSWRTLHKPQDGRKP